MLSCVSHAILRQASSLLDSTFVHDSAHAPSLHVYYVPIFFLAPTKKTRHGYNGLISFFFYYYYLGSEGDSSRIGRGKRDRCTVARRKTAEGDCPRGDFAREGLRRPFLRTGVRACAFTFTLCLVAGYAFACFRDRRNIHEREKEKDLRAANNVAQLRS